MGSKPTGKPNGRPSSCTKELMELICERVATHTVGLDTLCEMYDDMPHRTTINVWRYRDPEFSSLYARAKIIQADLMVEELNSIASSKMHYIDAEGNNRVDTGHVASQRLMTDTIKWQATKLARKVYGDAAKVENTIVVKHEDSLKELE